MRSTQPPAVATWLLRQFGCSPRNEAILGDLIEQYRHGRSRLWYWQQTLIALLVGLLRGVWQEKLRALVAVVTGWIILAFYMFRFADPLLRFIEFESSPNLALAQYVFSRVLPRHWMIYYYWLQPALLGLLFALLGSVVGAISGWVVAKFQPSARIPIVSLYAASQCGYHLFLISSAIMRWGLLHTFIYPGHEIRGLLMFLVRQIAWATIIASILFGGGLLKPRVENNSIVEGNKA